MNELLDKLNAIRPLSPELQSHLKEVLKYKEFPKDTFILRAGSVCENFYFIQKGLVGIFFENSVTEMRSWLLKESDITIYVVSFFKQKPSLENIQALEDTIVYYMTHNEYMTIFKNFPEYYFIDRKLLEKTVVSRDLWDYSLQTKPTC